MPKRVLSFAPGPSMLPEEVLHEYRANIDHFGETGLGILELGHRSDQFQELYQSTVEQIRGLLVVPAGYEVLLMHGGARFQFTMLPANQLPGDGMADYLETGHFAAAAAAEATQYGRVHIAASSRKDGFLQLPRSEDIAYSINPSYVHYTSNNTEMGTQFPRPPTAPAGAWLACDASSDLLTRPFDIDRHGCVYATSHKNLGTAGVAILILRGDLIKPVRQLAPFMSYATHAKASSCLNTPPISAIYVLNLMTRWTANHGGVDAMTALSAAKSQLIYRVIDESRFYTPLAASPDRSKVNVTFAAPTPDLEAAFQDEAKARGLIGLWGYRKVGHLRASLFNAISLDAATQLADFMESFARLNRHRMPRQEPRPGSSETR